MTARDVAEEIVTLEARGWDALTGAHGRGFYANLMAPDGIMVLPGMRLDREAALASIPDGTPSWDRFELTDSAVVELAPDVAVIVYTAAAWRGDEPPYRAAMSTVYVRRGGAWQLALHQQTPAP
jgi:hypothetical protein